MFLVFDIGGTDTKFAVIDEDFYFQKKGKFSTDAKSIKGEGVIKRLIEKSKEIVMNFSITAIGISTAGVVNKEKGTIIDASDNIPGYIGTDIRGMISEELNLPVYVDNDVNCALLGEKASGALKNYKNSIMITIGTGIGGAIMINNQIYRGNNYAAGEVGYMNIFDNFFEKVASASVLVEKVSKKEPTILNGKMVFESLHIKNVKEEVEIMYDNLARGIGTLVSILDPEVIVIGGGIVNNFNFDLLEIKARIIKYSNKSVYNRTNLVKALNGNMAGCIGAAYLAKENGRC